MTQERIGDMVKVLTTEDYDRMVAENEDLREELAALKAVHQRGCDCSQEDACKFAREVAKLKREREDFVRWAEEMQPICVSDAAEVFAMILAKLKREGE